MGTSRTTHRILAPSPVGAWPVLHARLTDSFVRKRAPFPSPPYSLASKSSTHVLLERYAFARNEPGSGPQSGGRFQTDFTGMVRPAGAFAQELRLGGRARAGIAL